MQGWLWDNIGMGDVPSTVDFLQEDAVVRFYASRKLREVDGMFIERMAAKNSQPDYVPKLVNPNTAEVVSTLSNTPIVIAARHDQTWNNLGDLLERTLLENGLCRFRLGNEKWFELWWGLDAQYAWLSQAWSIFHALEITVEDNLEAFVFTIPNIKLTGDPSRSKAKQQRRLQQPIYLFVRPFPPVYLTPNDKHWFQYQTTSLHYWSFREDGDSPLSHETCRYLGLPTVLRLTCETHSSSWATHVYKTIHGYQLLQGFDPRTTDFARHIGYNDPIFQPVNDSVHFEELSEERINGFPEPHVDSDPEDVYDELDDHSLTALFYTGSDDDTYTDSSHISNIQERKDLHEDSLSSSDGRTQDPAVSMTSKLTTKTDHGTNKWQTSGAESAGESEGIERREQHTDQVPECTTLSTLTTEHPSLLSISETVPFSNSTSPNVVLPTPSFPVQPTGLLATSHSETHKEDGAQPISTCTDANISTIGSNTIISMTDTHKNTGWSATSLDSTDHNSLCNALAGASNISPTVSHPPDLTIHTPVYSTSTVEYTIADVSLTRHHDGGPPVSVSQRHWIPRPFISNITPIAHRSLWPVRAAPRSPTRIEDNRRNKEANEDLD
ncbi:hypothetical protein PQX77_012731 [Marasmius sp. AFHP31]|nr:hypothetical protein PQX77_012731 [Marasmius sp. AFHP31]